jgi:hypothetical protein
MKHNKKVKIRPKGKPVFFILPANKNPAQSKRRSRAIFLIYNK